MSAAFRPALVAGVGLIVLGVLLGLHTLGVLPGGVPVGSLVVIGIGVALLLGAGQASPGPAVAAEVATAVDLAGATSARLVLNHGAGTLRLGAGAGEGALVDGWVSAALAPRITRSGDRLDVTLQPGPEWQRWPAGWRKIDWQLALARDVPVDLVVKTGASQVQLDLSELQVPSLTLQTGASDVDVTLPAHGECRVSIDAGAASVRLRVPEGVAASVRNRSALAGFSVDRQRFPQVNGSYESPEYATAADRVQIDVDGGVASFSVR